MVLAASHHRAWGAGRALVICPLDRPALSVLLPIRVSGNLLDQPVC
jgi:hypothetical protein